MSEPWFITLPIRLFAFCFYPEHRAARRRVRFLFDRAMSYPLTFRQLRMDADDLYFSFRRAAIWFYRARFYSLPLPMRRWMYRRGWLI